MKRFRIVQSTTVGYGLQAKICSREIISAYPEFTTLEEGHAYIRQVLDPGMTGEYGIVDEGKPINELTRDTTQQSRPASFAAAARKRL